MYNELLNPEARIAALVVENNIFPDPTPAIVGATVRGMDSSELDIKGTVIAVVAVPKLY